MASLVAAMSRASTSGVSRAKAFFNPSGLCKIRIMFPAESMKPRNQCPIPDESVDLDGVDIVQLLEGQLDLSLVRLDVHNENQGVVLLNLLHGTLSVERVKDNLVGVETGLMRDRLAGVLGRPRELKGLGTVEGGGSADLARLMRLIEPKDLSTENGI
jgi:hypothetical protein